ncbi:tetratricopeptide repeat protein [Flavobacterium sp.]|uniref:tetratricopeptide repeat protein n=1 Tax=Flavobacterium sp. TaxID=239 RepID=UPI00261DDB6A|nr:tetratricopeptide repeat protein [Flavobacterium sp.]
MKKITLLLLFTFSATFAQNRREAEALVNQGIPYHDKGDFEGAIDKYDKALLIDKDNLLALTEKALTLNAMKKYPDAIAVSKQAIQAHQGENLREVYVSYGNALDNSGKTDESLKIYDEALVLFPDYYQLHFNKGVTLSSIKRFDEAVRCFQNAIKIKPLHGSSLNAIGILEMNNNRIASILAFSRLAMVEPSSARAEKALEVMQSLMIQGVSQTGKKTISINIDSAVLSDTTATGSKKENNFSSTDLILSLTASQDLDKKHKNDSKAEKFIRKFEVICSSLQETKKNNIGIYWEQFVPYFTEMNTKKLIEPFAYLIFSASGDNDAEKWVNKNKRKVELLQYWSDNYNWNKQ